MDEPVKKIKIVCLANSWKHSGRCVAGKRLDQPHLGEWIRPVGGSWTEELNFLERAVEGREPRLLDVIEISIRKRVPRGCQRENCSIVPGTPWRLAGRLKPDEVAKLCDPTGPLWLSGYHVHNDRVPEAKADELPSSLRLIQVENPVWAPQEYEGKVRPRLQFRGDADRSYDLAVTDPVAVEKYGASALQSWRLEGHYLLCVSLGEPFHGYRYKLVAGIIPV